MQAATVNKVTAAAQDRLCTAQIRGTSRTTKRILIQNSRQIVWETLTCWFAASRPLPTLNICIRTVQLMRRILNKKNPHTHVYCRLAPGKHLARDLDNCVKSICLWRPVLPPMAGCRLLTAVLHPQVIGRPRRIHSCSLSYDRYTASCKLSYPHGAI